MATSEHFREEALASHICNMQLVGMLSGMVGLAEHIARLKPRRVTESMVSEHFSEKELACPHCGVNGCCPELLEALEAFRALAGKPVIVDSAYRCAVHNAAVGGAKRSEHMLGMAADIRVTGLTGAALEAIARQIPAIKGIGRSDSQNYLHVDVRPVYSNWCYSANGKQEPYYPPETTAV